MNEFYDLMICYHKSCHEDHYYFRSMKNAYDTIKQDMESQGYSPIYSYEEVETYMKENYFFRCGNGEYTLTRCEFED